VVEEIHLCQNGRMADENNLDFCGTGCLQAYLSNKLNEDRPAQEFDIQTFTEEHSRKVKPCMEAS
jgi:hypothetical protein